MDTEVPTFSPPETITVGELQPGDFVVEFPAQKRYRRVRVDSAVRTVEDDWETWSVNHRPGARRTPVESRRITFQHPTDVSLNFPLTWSVVARRVTA